jgi:hypothetical protein
MKGVAATAVLRPRLAAFSRDNHGQPLSDLNVQPLGSSFRSRAFPPCSRSVMSWHACCSTHDRACDAPHLK